MCHHHEFGCGHPGHHAFWGVGHHHWGCCCGGHGYPQHPATREESISQLEQYLKDLQAQAKALEERIEEIKKAA